MLLGRLYVAAGCVVLLTFELLLTEDDDTDAERCVPDVARLLTDDERSVLLFLTVVVLLSAVLSVAVELLVEVLLVEGAVTLTLRDAPEGVLATLVDVVLFAVFLLLILCLTGSLSVAPLDKRPLPPANCLSQRLLSCLFGTNLSIGRLTLPAMIMVCECPGQ